MSVDFNSKFNKGSVHIAHCKAERDYNDGFNLLWRGLVCHLCSIDSATIEDREMSREDTPMKSNPNLANNFRPKRSVFVQSIVWIHNDPNRIFSLFFFSLLIKTKYFSINVAIFFSFLILEIITFFLSEPETKTQSGNSRESIY